MREIRIMIASPSDVDDERKNAARIISDIKDVVREQGFNIDSFRWEVDSYPSFHKDGPQGKIDELAQINNMDIFVGIFWSKLGKKLPNSNETGTEHEFRLAYESWKSNSKPEIMFYFKNKAIPPSDKNRLKSSLEVVNFKETFPEEGLYWDYEDTSDFDKLFYKHVLKSIFAVINKKQMEPVRVAQEESGGQIEGELGCNIIDLHPDEISQLLISENNSDLYTSFHPEIEEPSFFRIKTYTTKGYVRFPGDDTEKEISNEVLIIRDPIRPFEIQIGETRSKRPGAKAGFLVLEDGLTLEGIKRMYPFILDKNDEWLRSVFAELATNPEVLQFIYEKDPSPTIKKIAAKNPNASNDLQKKDCLFCQTSFTDKRTIYVSPTMLTRIIQNDYPYGPYFHYIAIPREDIHSWANVKEEHFLDMNQSIYSFLNFEANGERVNLRKSAGVRIGLNSSIRHLVLGKSTQSSAGASIPHVHKQIWGMTPGAINLSSHLAKICSNYSERGIDYLNQYLISLKKCDLVLWEDDYCALYIPMGQNSVHELQSIIKRSNVSNFLELKEEEIRSFSRCEAIAAAIFKLLGINSFNELVLNMPFSYEGNTEGFRLITTFVTREIDLAVSELSLLYVVDKFPHDTLEEVRKIWSDIRTQFNLNYDI